ncbi:DNA-3-methyladenine glycosylase [Janibacter anophelis]|uniref:DNA-3-methyladenine glycosylase n=1 Tax=Janibacter anophelis TaxID=319054 RepID=UPI000DEF5851|nr:DNA-3-methyladenine glycosylase [Janibacter anophelis]
MAGRARRWTRADLARDPLSVARSLLGTHLVAGPVSLRLTEVEAYWGTGDPGSHGYRGMTPRTEVMFGPPGHLYVYRSYGIHWCANIVCGTKGECAAVLLRAGEVVAGHDTVTARRPDVRERDLARGPGRLTVALGLHGDDNGAALVGRGSPFVLTAPAEPVDDARVRTGPRVGVSGPGGDGATYPWRFWIEGEPSVSAYRPGKVRRG